MCALALAVSIELSRPCLDHSRDGDTVAPSTILRWVIRYTAEFVRRWDPFELVVGRSWCVDETYVKVSDAWMYLYRAVHKQGRTVASYLSRTRDRTAAQIFFRQALKRHGQPRSITLDGFEPSYCALRKMGMRGEFNLFGNNPVKIRSSKYLNNIVEQDHRPIRYLNNVLEQDHRAIKRRVRASQGFRSFASAVRTIQALKRYT